MKQTAVEYLIEWFDLEFKFGNFKKIIDEAKEMEKQQITEAVKFYMNTDGIINENELSEQYYNETFKK